MTDAESDFTERARVRAARSAGLRDASLVVLGYIPFGIAAGVVLASTSLGAPLAIATGPIIFAGASQLVAAQLLDLGAGIALVALTVGVVNARHLLYSASMAPYLADWSRGSRLGAAFLLADPVYALAYARFRGPDAGGARRERRAYYFAVGLTCLVGWTALVAAGLVAGAFVPEWVPLGLAIPLTFLLLTVPLLVDLPTLLAAIVGGLAAVAASALPLGMDILVGALVGIAAGAVALRLRGGAAPDPRPDPAEEVAP